MVVIIAILNSLQYLLYNVIKNIIQYIIQCTFYEFLLEFSASKNFTSELVCFFSSKPKLHVMDYVSPQVAGARKLKLNLTI